MCTGHVRPGPDELGTAWVAEPDVAALGLTDYAKLFEDAQLGRAEDVAAAIGSGGLDANREARDGRTALHFAAESGRQSVVAVLLRPPGINANKQDSDGQTPLQVAARWGEFEIVDLIRSHLEHGR